MNLLRSEVACLSLSLLFIQGAAFGQLVRITEPLQEGDRVAVVGNVHPLIAQATASTPVEPSTKMEHLVLHLQASAMQEAELEQLIAQQNDPQSPNYHKFLTPQQFAARFGVAPADIERVSAWLQSHGATVEQVPAGNRAIVFSGNAEQVANAFNTEIRQYTVNGARHLANASDPEIPRAFANVVGGVLKLNDFQRESRPVRSAEQFQFHGVMPAFAPAGLRWLVPGDYATIYDINPLLSAGIDGTGQAIAVLARSNIYLSDVESFRQMFGLKSNDPKIVITNSDPGEVADDTIETTLDTEWAGAIAPGATVKVIVSSSGSGGDGIDLSATYAVNNNVAPILTLSYGSCEALMGSTELAFYNSLWKQAAVQGQTVLVAAGDSGAAGCDSGTATASQGKAVNGLCSSPYSTCVGGTEFVEGSNPGQFWLPSSPGSTAASALSYIPESVWNESGTVSGGSGLWSGGGGASKVYTKPSWQTGPGVPADNARDVPDLSLTAASHDGYTIVQGGALGYIFAVSGTSASTPSFAGIMALVGQKNNSAQGNINAVLYQLAAKQATGGAAVFHDITSGNNSVPGLTGYSAAGGYDLASGLGSVDANLLATLWNTATAKPASLTVAAGALVVSQGQSGTTNVTTVANGLNAAVALTISGLPTGVTATLSSTSVAAPGSGTVTLKLAVAANATAGTYSVTVKAAGGSQTSTTTFSLTIGHPTFTLSYKGGEYPQLIFGPNPPYAPQAIPLKILPSNGFNSTITFTAAGMPTGMTVTFAPTTVSGGSVSSTTATVTVASTVKGGSYQVTISASGGGVTQSVTYLIQVFVQPSCAITPNQYSASFNAGGGTTFTLSCAGAATNTNLVTLSAAGAPGGVATKFSSPTVKAGSSATLTLTSTGAVNPGTYALTVTGSEPNGATQTLCLFVAISTPVFTLSSNPAQVVGIQGTTTQFTAVVTPNPGFTGAVTVWIGGLPNGVTASFSSAPGSSLSKVITLTVASTAVAGNYVFNLGAGAMTGYSLMITPTLTIQAPPACTLASASTTAGLKLTPGQSVTTPVTCVVSKGAFPAPLSLTVSGLPSAVVGQFSPATLTPGSSTTLTLTGTTAAATGSSKISITATGSGYTQTISVPITVVAPSFSISTGASAVTLKVGSTATVAVNSSTVGLFNSAIALAALNLPKGVAATFSKTSLPAPGTGSVTMTLTASSTATTGSYTINPTGTGGGLTSAANLSLTVTH